eukprot:CCRYP_017194-RA/>CCRYP_017194-RA protein AED:0.03 eAED:0.03 QI:84/1/1/1/1/1/3/370/339
MTNNNTPSSSSSSTSWSTIPIRLLSSVAVVGRDNEPIYLRGDLCHVPVHASHTIDHVDDDDSVDDDGIVDDADNLHHSADASSSSFSQKRGLLGRMRGVLSPNETGTKTDHEKDDATTKQQDDGDDDDDEDDPFGFFTEQPNNAPSSSMSLTQQLVLHASLDRFEEMTVRSGSHSGGRWRMPGSSGPNAMWMGLLCEVEERWNVYGYLTNTGVKFMIIVENVQVDEEGIRQNEYASSLLSNSSSFVDPIPTTSLSSSSSSNRESDLKHIFSHLHELYVRYTLNPFTKLRSPIQSRAFDRGIIDMAQSFNEKAWKCVCEERGVECGSSSSLLLEGSLSWM